jgi:TfoX/Sxy family transcriptional regulator of competence genes
MPFDEKLAGRVRRLLDSQRSVEEKRMFGGLAFMVNGHMCCGVLNQDLVVRVAREEHDEAMSRPHVRPMDFTGRPMRGLLYVSPAGFRSARDLGAWVRRSLRFVSSLPPK